MRCLPRKAHSISNQSLSFPIHVSAILDVRSLYLLCHEVVCSWMHYETVIQSIIYIPFPGQCFPMSRDEDNIISIGVYTTTRTADDGACPWETVIGTNAAELKTNVSSDDYQLCLRFDKVFNLSAKELVTSLQMESSKCRILLMNGKAIQFVNPSLVSHVFRRAWNVEKYLLPVSFLPTPAISWKKYTKTEFSDRCIETKQRSSDDDTLHASEEDIEEVCEGFHHPLFRFASSRNLQVVDISEADFSPSEAGELRNDEDSSGNDLLPTFIRKDTIDVDSVSLPVPDDMPDPLPEPLPETLPVPDDMPDPLPDTRCQEDHLRLMFIQNKIE
jgi:hypothetical protein